MGSLSGNGALQASIWLEVVAMFRGKTHSRRWYLSSSLLHPLVVRGGKRGLLVFAYGRQKVCLEGPGFDTIWGNLRNLNGGG